MSRMSAPLSPDTSEDGCLLGEPLGGLRLIMRDGGPDEEEDPRRWPSQMHEAPALLPSFS